MSIKTPESGKYPFLPPIPGAYEYNRGPDSDRDASKY